MGLRQGMMVFHQRLQTLFQNMGVNLRCGNIRMPQHLLNRTQIRPMGQEMAGKGMAQRVGREPLRRNARLGCQFFEQLAKPVTC